MARKAQHSGQHMIDRAQEYFEASVKAGAPDYRFVAVAIGAAPIAPPRWAFEACIAAKEDLEKRSAARVPGDLIDRVLDELVRFYDREQRQRDEAGRRYLDKPTSIRSALLQVYDLLGEGRRGNANDDWFRTARRAWEKEQKEDRRYSSFRLDRPPIRGSRAHEGFHITGRIERVLMEVQGPDYGYPADPVKALWLFENNGGGG